MSATATKPDITTDIHYSEPAPTKHWERQCFNCRVTMDYADGAYTCPKCEKRQAECKCHWCRHDLTLEDGRMHCDNPKCDYLGYDAPREFEKLLAQAGVTGAMATQLMDWFNSFAQAAQETVFENPHDYDLGNCEDCDERRRRF